MEKVKEQRKYIDEIKNLNKNNKNLKYCILTMGCQLNENDSEKLCGMLEEMGITVPVALHLDHGSYDHCYKCIEAGFSSVMFDLFINISFSNFFDILTNSFNYLIDNNQYKNNFCISFIQKLITNCNYFLV